MGCQVGSWKTEMDSLNAQTTFHLFLLSPNPVLKTHSCGMFFYRTQGIIKRNGEL